MSRGIIELSVYVLTLFMLFSTPFQIQQVHAPELIRGEMISYYGPIHIGYINGGDWQALMIGKRTGDIEVGVFIRIGGAHIDNNDMPIAYRIEWRNEHKFRGVIQFRGSLRKLCGADTINHLPCH